VVTEATIATGVAAALQRTWGQAVTVREVRRLTGGAVHETWAVMVARADGAEERLVLRAFPPYGPQALGAEAEYTLLAAAWAAGVAVPQPVALLGAEDLERPGYLMAYVAGETLGRRVVAAPALAAARAVLLEQAAVQAARIHAVPVTAALRRWLRGPEAGESAAAAELRRLEASYRALATEPHPVYELALRWLGQRLPGETGEVVLVHGDYRVGNLVVGPEGLRAVLDWEGAHLGDPAEDLGWFCVRSWRFGAWDRPAGGLGSREAWLAAYAAVSGREVAAERVRWWEVLGNVRWGVSILAIAQPFLAGQTRDVEPGAIGRRFAETEMELLDLIADAP
jgi:aminoglycoside phosphotransferase (APT) family kinase protein